MPRPPRRAGHGLGRLVRSLGPLAGPLGLRMVFWDHRGHGRSEWVPVEQCTQDQLVADVEGVRLALGLGPVDVLGISWGGYLGLMYAARHRGRFAGSPSSGRRPATSSCPARKPTRAGRPRRSNGRPTARSGTARSRRQSFRRAFETIRPLYFHDKALAAAANVARADTRYRIAVRQFVIDARVRDLRLPRRAAADRLPDPRHGGASRLDLPVDQAEEIHRLIPHSELTIFEASGHSPQIEEREAFTGGSGPSSPGRAAQRPGARRRGLSGPRAGRARSDSPRGPRSGPARRRGP